MILHTMMPFLKYLLAWFPMLLLAIANGAGAASRRSLGTGVFFGMLTATTVGIFFIPLFFGLIRRVSERGRKPAQEVA